MVILEPAAGPCRATSRDTPAASARARAAGACCRRGRRCWESRSLEIMARLDPIRAPPVERGPALAAVGRERALLADGVGTLEDPVLPGGEAAEDLRLHRFGAGEAQVGLHAGERVGREARRSSKASRTSSSQSISSGAENTRPASSASGATNGPVVREHRSTRCGLAEEAHLQTRLRPLLIGYAPAFIGESWMVLVSSSSCEHVGAVGGERQLEERAGKGIARLDEREEGARRQIDALQRAADVADDLADQPVAAVRGQRGVDAEHGRRIAGRAQQPPCRSRAR